jgi:amyloid beta precursor protein binding protein 1
VRSYGYIGYCRLQINHHTIIESKPDGDQYDLRIVNPFPELHNFFHDERFDLLKLNSLDHAHVPFVILLSKALQAYKLQV